MADHDSTTSAQGAHGQEVVVDTSHHTHVCSFQTFTAVFGALLVLTVVTVAVSLLDFGSFNLLIAMAIAAVKASLVVTVFMHLKWDTAINNIAFLSSLLFLALLFLFLIADVATRGMENSENGAPDPSYKPAAESTVRPH